METKTGLNLKGIQSELSKPELITSVIDRFYKQKAQLNILREERAEDFFYRILTLDILDHKFGFAPVAYCIVNITDAGHLENTEIYHIVENCCKDCEIEFHSLIDDTEFPEVRRYLKSPYYGRVVLLTCNGREVGTLTEFFSAQSNELADKSVLEYLAKNPNGVSSKRRLEDLLSHLNSAFNCDKTDAIDVLFADFPKSLKKLIEAHIEEIDHFGFLISPELSIEELNEILSSNGFGDNQKKFGSVIMAKELGQRLNRDEVKTEIIKASITNGIRAVEMFLPQESLENIRNWINTGIGCHIAFRTKSNDSIYKILNALNENHIPIPSFMMGRPLKNTHEGSEILYCEAKSGDYRYRIEFIYYDRRKP